MSFRELRNFCEIMRSLGYPRIISMDNFRIPNFNLVAEIIFWFVRRIDPKAQVYDRVEEEEHRVEFIKSACQFFYQNLKLKITPKKLYSSDGYAVQELLKIADILYKAKISVNSKEDYEFSSELDITSRKQDISQIKSLSSEIVESGLNLLDLLDKEKFIKESRESAIDFLENIAKNSDSKKEQEEVEKKIITMLQSQQNKLEKIDTLYSDLKSKAIELEEEIKMKQVEYERAEKRLESLNNARPTHFHETRQLEAELSYIYRIYVEKVRNHDFLAHQLEKYHLAEEVRNKNIDKDLKAIHEKIRRINDINIYDENEVLNADDNNEDEYDTYQKDARNKVNYRNGNANSKFTNEQQELDHENDVEEQEEEEDDGAESESDNNF